MEPINIVEPINMLGDYLRKRRGDMSLREFAEQCGISHTHLDSIEKGRDPRTGKKVSITTDTLSSIAKKIGVDYSYLACLADNVDPHDVQNVPIPADEQKNAPALTDKDKRDVAKDVEKIMGNLENSGELMFDGVPMSDEAKASMAAAMKLGLEAARSKNKETYTPKKYRGKKAQ